MTPAATPKRHAIVTRRAKTRQGLGGVRVTVRDPVRHRARWPGRQAWTGATPPALDLHLAPAIESIT